jgi:hypothetical protein
MNQFKKLAVAGAVSALMMGATAAKAHVSYMCLITPMLH